MTRPSLILAAVEAVAIALIAASGALSSSHDYTYDFDIPYFVSGHPHFVSNSLPSGPERVDIDLSLDGGSNWTHRLAHGHPSHYGTNIYHASLSVTPDMWTEQARIAVRMLWSSTTNAVICHQGNVNPAGNISIAGLRITSPAAGVTVYSPSYTPINWHEAGVDYVEIGLSSNGVDVASQVMLESPDLTGSYTLPITDRETGPMWIMMRGIGVSNMWDSVQVECINVQ